MNEETHINFVYFKGIVPPHKLNSSISELKKHNINLKLHDKTGEPQMCLEHFLAEIYLSFPSDIVGAYLTGMMAGATYDVIKTTIGFLWPNVERKKITKKSPGKVAKEKDATFGVEFTISELNKFHLKFSGNLSDSIKQKFIDEAFEFPSVSI